ncbi:MAG: hypothetical protein AAF654_10940 [Myxococcota bacterium]
MTDLRREPSKPTWLRLRHGIKARVVRHASPNVKDTPQRKTTALCEMPSGELAEIGYWELGQSGQSQLFYGPLKRVEDIYEPMSLGRILNRVKGRAL